MDTVSVRDSGQRQGRHSASSSKAEKPTRKAVVPIEPICGKSCLAKDVPMPSAVTEPKRQESARCLQVGAKSSFEHNRCQSPEGLRSKSKSLCCVNWEAQWSLLVESCQPTDSRAPVWLQTRPLCSAQLSRLELELHQPGRH